MELLREELPINSISSYTEQTVIINNNSEQNTIKMPCFISNTHIQSPASLEQINELIQKSNIEILIIGATSMLHPKQLVVIKQSIECESMNIISAIYSYNILIGDMRNAGVLLIPD